MSRDYRLAIEYYDDGKWNGLLDEAGKLWESEYWGISCVKRAFLEKNAYQENLPADWSKEIYDLYGEYMSLNLVEDFSVNLDGAYNKQHFEIIGDFIKDLGENISRSPVSEYRLIVFWC